MKFFWVAIILTSQLITVLSLPFFGDEEADYENYPYNPMNDYYDYDATEEQILRRSTGGGNKGIGILRERQCDNDIICKESGVSLPDFPSEMNITCIGCRDKWNRKITKTRSKEATKSIYYLPHNDRCYRKRDVNIYKGCAICSTDKFGGEPQILWSKKVNLGKLKRFLNDLAE